MDNIKYSFVVPVYNEKNNILPFILEIKKIFINEYKNYEIIFVDNNSPDGTEDEVNRLSKNYDSVKLLQHGVRRGLGAAIRFGYDHAIGDIIIGIDVDLSQSPKQLFSMIRKVEIEKYDMVIGSRYLKDSKFLNKGLIRKIGSSFFNKFSSFILKTNLSDGSHSFRVFKKKILKEIPVINEDGHPAFLIEFTYRVKQRFKITEIPITFVERDKSKGVSKLDMKSVIFSSIKSAFLIRFKK